MKKLSKFDPIFLRKGAKKDHKTQIWGRVFIIENLLCDDDEVTWCGLLKKSGQFMLLILN